MTLAVQNPATPEAASVPIEILLVDDREENLLALEAVLASPDYTLARAQSGEQALRYLLDHSPALIVMDVQMPGLDGFETASIIKSGPKTRDIPIIFITALNKDERYIYKGYAYGAVDYIYKPFDAQILRSKVEVFVDLFRKSERLLRTERRLRETENRERERKIAELELKSLRREQAEQKRYRELVAGINHGVVWSLEPATLAVTFVSDSAERLTGFSGDAWMAKSKFFFEHVHPADQDRFQQAVGQVAMQGGECEIEHRFVTASGEAVWWQTGLRSLTNPQSLTAEIQGLSVDITKMKRAEAILRQNQRRSEFLAKASRTLGESLEWQHSLPKLANLCTEQLAQFCLIEIADGPDRLATAAVSVASGIDGTGLEVFRGPSREISFLRIKESVLLPEVTASHLEDLEPCAARRARLTRHLPAFMLRVPLATRDRFLGLLTLLREADPEVYGEDDLALAQDLAFRVSSAVENAILFDEAETAVKVRDEFLAIASHELRTPLTPLKLHTQQLIRTIKARGEAAITADSLLKVVQTTNRQVERLSKLIDSLLDITRISRGKLSLNPVEFELDALIEEVSSRLSGELENAGCELRLNVQPGVRVRWDNFRMEQVVENLLSNAIKYARGQPIDLAAHRAGADVEIAVRDYGIGISHEDQPRIFRRFERAVSSRHFGGLGLGLYIVSQILEAHRGTISVESEPGQGSLFRVVLPAALPLQAVNSPTPDSAA